MTWRVCVWCKDCCGEDFEGCFDGGLETLEEKYTNKEQAEKAGEDFISRCASYKYKVYEESEE